MKRELQPPRPAEGRSGSRVRRSGLAALCAWVLMAMPPAGGAESDVRRDATVDAVERVMPSVVNIRTSQLVRNDDFYETVFRRFYGLDDARRRETERESSVGSGVIVEASGDEGYILTNLHVTRRASRVQVQLWDGRIYDAKQLLSTYQKDLVLLQIVRKPGEKAFQPIRLAGDDDLLLGETVVTVGNPFGLGGSVSRGILSSKNRRPMPGDQPLDFQDWLQTDADINPGNSGGPLINLRGELIGINVAIYGQEQGMGLGFAIPVKQVSSALSDFFTLEWTASLWFGARLRTATNSLIIREVQPNSPADRAGLRVGQQVEEVNGSPVRGLVDFNKLVAANADHRATITVRENNARRAARVELMPMKELMNQMLLHRLGVSAQTPTREVAARFQIAPGDGLLLGDVEKGGPAERAQLQSGFLLTAIDGHPVSSLVNAVNALGNKKPGERVELQLLVPRRAGANFLQPQPATIRAAVR
jgi:S1-C subfamily serine protease